MELRDYQIEISNKACELLKKFKLAYLSLEVRTGKTITALETAKKFGAKNVLFVTKKKAIGSILSDYENYANSFDLKALNFESIHKLDFIFDLVIIDEAHSLGQYPKPSNRTVMLKSILKDKPIIFLSGTPSPESLSQIYHQFWISSFTPFQESNFYKWAKVYVNVTKKYLYNREINDYSGAKVDLINSKIKHLFLSFTQKEAGFDAIVNERFLTVKMKDITYKLVNSLIKDRVIEGKTGVILADTAVKLMQKTHQLFSGSVILESGECVIIDKSKAEFIKIYFEGKKIAIFYKFKAEFEMLKEFFNWTESPEEFQNSENKTFLGQFQSAREGIRLDTAEALVFLNIDFSFLSYEQSKNRLVSKERSEPANVFWIFSENGIESKIYEKVINKQDYTLNYYKHDFRI